jgi:hypothetical protein
MHPLFSVPCVSAVNRTSSPPDGPRVNGPGLGEGERVEPSAGQAQGPLPRSCGPENRKQNSENRIGQGDSRHAKSQIDGPVEGNEPEAIGAPTITRRQKIGPTTDDSQVLATRIVAPIAGIEGPIVGGISTIRPPAGRRPLPAVASQIPHLLGRSIREQSHRSGRPKTGLAGIGDSDAPLVSPGPATMRGLPRALRTAGGALPQHLGGQADIQVQRQQLGPLPAQCQPAAEGHGLEPGRADRRMARQPILGPVGVEPIFKSCRAP